MQNRTKLIALVGLVAALYLVVPLAVRASAGGVTLLGIGSNGLPTPVGVTGDRLRVEATAPAGGMEVRGVISTPSAAVVPLTANAGVCSAADESGCTIVLPAVEVVGYPRFALTVYAGAAILNDVLVQFSPRPDATMWETWDASIFSGLPASGVRSMQIGGNSRRWLRVKARAAANSSAEVYLTASK